MRSIFACCLLIYSLLTSVGLHAENLVREQSFFEDSTQKMSFAEVLKKDTTPFKGALSKGYSESAFWIRLVIGGIQDPESTNAQRKPYVIRIGPSFLDEVALYDPANPNAQPEYAGDRHPTAPHSYVSLNHNFLITLTNEPRVIWLRLVTTSTSNLQVEALTLDETLNSDRKQEIFTGVFVASFVIFVIWAVIYGYRSPDPFAIVLISSQGITLIHALTLWGYIRVWFSHLLDPAFLDILTSVFILLSASSFLWFHTRFIAEFSPPPLLLKTLQLLLILLPIELTFFATGHVGLGLKINMLMALVCPPLLLMTALLCKGWDEVAPGKPKPVFSKTMLVSFYGLLNVMAWVLVLQGLGITQENKSAISAGPMFGFFSGLVLITTLQLRSRRILEANAEMELKLQLAEQDAAQEKRQREQQSKFMGMLTHELKTPLAVLLMAINSSETSPTMFKRAKRAIRDMNGVIERCALVDKLEEGDLTQAQERFDICGEIKEIAHGFENQQLILKTTDSMAIVHTDRQLISVVIKNLIENALKYSAPHSPVEMQLQTSAADAMVIFTISNLPGDSGWPDPDRLFSKYYRSPGSHRTTGSGLGLHLSRNIAIYLGGDLRYLPDPKHVRFEFCIPF